MELKAKYEQRIEQAEAELRQVKNKILRISTLRVLLFAAGIIGTIYFYQAGTPTICLTIAVTFVPFLALVKYHNRLFFRKDWLESSEKLLKISKVSYAWKTYRKHFSRSLDFVEIIPRPRLAPL